MNDGPEWFAPKRYGYGATPISWQGWALTLGFAAIAILLSVEFANRPLQLIAALAPLTIAFMVICARTTQWLALALGRRRLADRQIALLVDEPPFVEVGQHDPRRLLGEVRRAR